MTISTSDDAKQHLRRWLERILEARRWKPAELARQSGTSPSTIGRALDPDSKFLMTTTIINRIAQAARMPPPAEIVGNTTGLAEPEAEQYTGDVDASLEQQDNLDNWTLRSRALDLAGYLPGDIVQVSRTEPARDGDIVCAQIYDQSGGAQTVFRLYEQPYLVTRTSSPDAHRKPDLVDGQRVLIMGVVTKSIRIRS